MSTATKRCPYCAEEIQAEAVKCKHCQSWLGAPEEMPQAASPAAEPLYPPPATSSMLGQLRRSSTDRILAGVCGGLGKATGIDPTIMRILWALGSFFTAIVPGIIVYVILALIIPPDDQEPIGWK